MNRFKENDAVEKKIDHIFNVAELPPELKVVDENIRFEKQLADKPIAAGMGEVDVFGTTWDINSILKGNYWRRSIYTTDKLCKLFLKADLNQKKKYLSKRNPMSFDLKWLLVIAVVGVVALLVIMFLLPRLGGAL